MIKERYQIRSSIQLKNGVKKYKEYGEITDTRGKSRGMKGISNPLKGKHIHFKMIEEERDYNKVQVEYLKKQLKNIFTFIAINGAKNDSTIELQ